jgi:hypothetical protein
MSGFMGVPDVDNKIKKVVTLNYSPKHLMRIQTWLLYP